MDPQFWLGFSCSIGFFCLGFAFGFNSRFGQDLREFNKRKGHKLKGIIE